MKKLTALWVSVICALLLALSGCANKDVFTQKSYQSDESDITSITLRVTDRELEIGASKDNRVHIYYFDGEKEYLDITVSENNELTIESKNDKAPIDFIGIKPTYEYRKIKLEIPDNTIVSLSASTTNEDIKISALSFTERVDLNANGGNISCERINVGKSIKLTAKNGNISGSIVGDRDDFSISCKIKKGDCNLPELKEGGEKSFFADCNNGDIEIEFTK